MDNFEQVGQSVLSKVEPLTSQPFYKETMSKLNDLDDMAIKLSHKPHLKDEYKAKTISDEFNNIHQGFMNGLAKLNNDINSKMDDAILSTLKTDVPADCAQENYKRADFNERMNIIDDDNFSNLVNKTANKGANVEPFKVSAMVERNKRVANVKDKQKNEASLAKIKQSINYGLNYKNDDEYKEMQSIKNAITASGSTGNSGDYSDTPIYFQGTDGQICHYWGQLRDQIMGRLDNK